jgi:N-acyl-D-amino-acid deacylase
MARCDTLILNATVIDGSGAPAVVADVALASGRIKAIGPLAGWNATHRVDAEGRVLSPGFIDVHTHDDVAVVREPAMWPKLSQGVTTVVVGNCGISAAPVTLRGRLANPMNLLGALEEFRYPTFGSYIEAVGAARPAVNVAALVGHTALRNNVMDRLDRPAREEEITAMRQQLSNALDFGAIGLSTGLAYDSAFSAPTDEVIALLQPLAHAGAIYATHMRNEFAEILDAMEESFEIGRSARVPVMISHLKCAGRENWGRSTDVLRALESAREEQAVGVDCYPYTAGSSTLDLGQITDTIDITITWSEPHPEMGGKPLREIAAEWSIGLLDAGRRLQPAGAIYHSMSEDDMRRILRHPATAIGSDGLPNDPHPHPRLWGTFPRVLGFYSRDEQLFPLVEAVRKMTGLSAERFQLGERGLVREGYWADLVLFDPSTVRDVATFDDPMRPSEGIAAVWVNGVLSSSNQTPTGQRAGRFLKRMPAQSVSAIDANSSLRGNA